jgi:hypothetical protein
VCVCARARARACVAGYCRCNPLVVYSGDLWFESRPGYKYSNLCVGKWVNECGCRCGCEIGFFCVNIGRDYDGQTPLYSESCHLTWLQFGSPFRLRAEAKKKKKKKKKKKYDFCFPPRFRLKPAVVSWLPFEWSPYKFWVCHWPFSYRVADGDGLQTWKVAANILNKQSRTADKGWTSNFRGCWARG